MLPDLLGAARRCPTCASTGPTPGPQTGATLLMVSNNPYDLQRPRVAGSRPRLDAGTLGILSARLRTPRKSPGSSR